MVAVKGKSKAEADLAVQEKKTSSRKLGEMMNFKIYAEVENEKARGARPVKGNSVLPNAGRSQQKIGDSKGGMKNLEKIKSQPDKSLKMNVGRKVLSDISNVRRSFTRTEQGRISGHGIKTSERISHPQRCREEIGNMETSSSDKPSTGKTVKISQTTGENKTLNNPISRNIKAISNEPKTKTQVRNSAAGTLRASIRNPLHPTRNSLPALKVGQVKTSGMKKEIFGNSEKLKEKHGFPVKSSTQRSIITRPSNLSSSRPWGNRVSDGFIGLASRANKKVEPSVIARKSVKPTAKTTSTTLNCQEKSKSNYTFAMKKLKPAPVALTKKKQEKVSLCKDIPAVSHEESAPKEVVVAGTGGATCSSSEIIARRKSGRRDSYTRLLISKSKECSKVKSPETLPNIYDHRNHLEVSDYVDDIYQYYWVTEAHNPPLKNYLEMQIEIMPQMRGILINWLVEVHLKFELMEETLFLTVTLLDRYLSLESIKKNEMQLVGLTALLLASKYEDFWHPRVSDLVSIAAESYTKNQMLQMERTILRKLKFRLNEPTLYVFMLRFLKAAQSDTKFEHLAFYLIELCLVEYEALNYKPSMLCASAVYVARCTMRMTPAWSSLLSKHARYGESEIRECAKMILKFHKAAKTSLLKVTYEKYMKLDRCRVATIKPLDRLPL